MDSPGSPLSDLSSDDFAEDVKADDRSLSVDTFHAADHEGGRPTKRQRTGPSGLSNHRAMTPEGAPLIIDPEPDIYLSEDTEGSVPASPNHPSGFGGMQDEESLGQEQVTMCKWEGCEAGDMGNMDNLVEHLHDDHIGTRQKKYSCEWSDCSRKGIPHASGYALRAHMRSHTREKPFYCTLPECDRAFTRSDALAKHMRTVHETEALRPSDPVPKHHSSNPSNKAQRLRLVFKKTPGANGTDKSATPVPMSPQHDDNKPLIDDSYENHNVIYIASSDGAHTTPLKEFPADIQFSPQELAMPAPALMRLLKRQVDWATEEAEEIKAELEALERSRKDEWAAKELALENLMEIEQLRMEQRDRSLIDEGEEFRCRS
ncbi:hypothetical protein K490DRAFT_75418 [Saccharata proteae CBS 121410]|uniref:C2H2-type domain-containing protein n=1 Tax=Saccharata proteae CBS 121410 TaxID=1314787 RepID=A0A9P4LWK3_9PEZI|nr:hypothetical protein K490DRAFT_75418 [Saccharata proteae CBS 121410]